MHDKPPLMRAQIQVFGVTNTDTAKQDILPNLADLRLARAQMTPDKFFALSFVTL